MGLSWPASGVRDRQDSGDKGHTHTHTHRHTHTHTCMHTHTQNTFQSHEDVEKMGVANYNAECRKIVMRYSSEWENIITRMGRWIDFKNDYKTLYPWFMESIW